MRTVECYSCHSTYEVHCLECTDRVLTDGGMMEICGSCWNRLVNSQILWTIRGWEWLPVDGPIYRGLQDARWKIREYQSYATDPDIWHLLSDSLNYLDARIDNMRDALGIGRD